MTQRHNVLRKAPFLRKASIFRKTLWGVAFSTTLFSAAAQAAASIEVWHSLPGPAALELDRIARDFNASQGDFVVMPLYRGNERETLEAGLAAQRRGQGPHLVQVDDSLNGVTAAAPRSFVPVYQVMERARQSLNASAFLPLVRDGSEDERGRLVSLPLNASTPLLFFNRDALKTAGVDPDTPLKTWLNVQAVALKLVDSGASCAYTSESPAWVHVENLLARHNEAYGAGQGRQAKAAFNTRLLNRHIALLSSWVQSGLFSYFGRHAEGEKRFAAGECAIMTGSSNSLADVRRRSGFGVGVTPLPVHEDFSDARTAVLPRVGSLWVMSGKKAPEYTGVAQFLAYLAKPEVQAEWHQATGYLPTTQAAYELSRKQGFYEREPLARVAIAQVESAPAKPGGSRFVRASNVRDVVDDELEAVWARRKTPMEGIGDALARANKSLGGAAKP